MHRAAALCGAAAAAGGAGAVRVAVYGGHGTAGVWHGKEDHGQYTVDALAQLGVTATLVQEDYVINTLSRDVADVVWFPGGGAHAYGNVIGDAGIARIRDFVAAGGGYVGTCAGAYFATTCTSSAAPHGQGPPCAGPPDQAGPGAKGPLGFVNADTKEPYHRGDGYVDFAVNDDGRRLLGIKLASVSNVTYADGPMLIPANKTGIPPYTVLGRFTTSVPCDQCDTMVGEPAVVVTTHGKGKVLAAVPHAELSIGDGSAGTPELLQLLQGYLTYVTPGSASGAGHH